MHTATASDTTPLLAALGFIERLPAFESAEELLDEMQRVLAPHGIEKIMVRTLPQRSLAKGLVAARWPREFIDYYDRAECIRYDPIARRARLSASPFLWDASLLDRECAQTRELMQVAAAFGLAEGVVVPIHRPHGRTASVSLMGGRMALDAHDLPVLRAMALYVFDELWRRHEGRNGQPCRALTTREQEVLALSADGNTAQEIADILHIAKRTVDEHSGNVCRKLKAFTRTHAVAIAVREGLIHL